MKPTYFTSSATIEDKENLTTSKRTTKTKNVTSAIETSAASIMTTTNTTNSKFIASSSEMDLQITLNSTMTTELASTTTVGTNGTPTTAIPGITTSIDFKSIELILYHYFTHQPFI